MHKDVTFNWNYYGMSLAEMGHFKDAEGTLLRMQNEAYETEYAYISWLAYCNITNSNPESAWELYLKMETSEEYFKCPPSNLKWLLQSKPFPFLCKGV